MIMAYSLSKHHDATTNADNLTFEVPSGVVTRFLGPNCSLKSRTIRNIVGRDIGGSESALIDGSQCSELAWQSREVGGPSDSKAFRPACTARTHLPWLAPDAPHNAAAVRRCPGPSTCRHPTAGGEH
jgi:ABC-2 type transport system ATP-binding protein